MEYLFAFQFWYCKLCCYWWIVWACFSILCCWHLFYLISNGLNGIKFWDPCWRLWHIIYIRVEHLSAFQFWYCEPCVESWWGGGRRHCWVIFVLRWCFNCCWVRGCGMGDTLWDVWHIVVCCINWIFFMFQIFIPWKLIKNLGLPWSSITVKVNSQAGRYLF